MFLESNSKLPASIDFNDRAAHAWWKDQQGNVQYGQLSDLLNGGWKIEREFITTRTRILTSKIRKINQYHIACCNDGCNHCMAVEKETEVLTNVTNFVLSKRQTP